MSQYLESIQRFDHGADNKVVENIVKHLGIALQSADGQTVAITDPDEIARIRDGFCEKHLGLNADAAEKLIADVAQMLQNDAAKCRVTFYYLLAQKAGQLDRFA